MAKKVSLDEFMSKRQAHIGKTADGKEAVFKGSTTSASEVAEKDFSPPGSWDEAKRSADFIMSSETIDRHGDIVRQEGLSTERFMANPQGLLFHSSRQFPVGLWENVKRRSRPAPKRTEGTLKFAPAGGPIPEVEQAAWSVANGLVRTVSIGFMPLDLEEIEHNDETRKKVGWSWGFDIKSSELYECSLVPIPAQPDAIAKGMIERDEMPAARDFLERALDEWAKDPRTGMLIPKKELEGIYARYFGNDGPVIMGLDLGQPREKSVLGQIDGKLKEAAPFTFDGERLVLPAMKLGRVVLQKGPADAGVTANTGTQIVIHVEQPGGTGSNTRVGSDVGDGASGEQAAQPLEQRSAEPVQSTPRLLRAKTFAKIGGQIASMLGLTTPEPKHIEGSLSRARAAHAERAERLAP